MQQHPYSFLTWLFGTLVITFLLHLAILFFVDEPLFKNRIVASYLINFFLASVILLIIQKTFKKEGSHAGFIFMAGSGLKFLVFFIVFYPAYIADETMQRVEFAAFFVPYALCLILEVIYLSKRLNNQSS